HAGEQVTHLPETRLFQRRSIYSSLWRSVVGQAASLPPWASWQLALRRFAKGSGIASLRCRGSRVSWKDQGRLTLLSATRSPSPAAPARARATAAPASSRRPAPRPAALPRR